MRWLPSAIARSGSSSRLSTSCRASRPWTTCACPCCTRAWASAIAGPGAWNPSSAWNWILLADEPTGNLDQKVGKEIISLFSRLNQEEGVTLVIVTHDHEIAAMAPRRVEIIDGSIVSDSTTG